MKDIKTEPVTEEDLRSLSVTVEPYTEKQVQEYNGEGDETYVQHIGLTEKLTDNSSRIDFRPLIKGNTGDDDTTPPAHVWTDVIRNLNSAYTEVCVLLDLMSILRHQQYLTLDSVEQPKPSYNTLHVMVAKKQGLRNGAAILRKGADNLKLGDIGQYHQALSILRKRFKLKKQGVHVLGDATYRSCGSKYTHEGVFEVMRNDSPLGYPLKIDLDPSIKMISYIQVSHSIDTAVQAHPALPEFWAYLPESHQTILGALHSIFHKQLFYLLSVQCMHYIVFGGVICQNIENNITVKLEEGRKLFITKHTKMSLKDVFHQKPTRPLNIYEICLQLHLHKGHKQAQIDEETEAEQLSTMMLGVTNNKARQPMLLNFQVLHVYHKVKYQQLTAKLHDVIRGIKEPVISVHQGGSSTPHESIINITLQSSSRIISATKVSLRITIGSKGLLKLDSSQYGSVFCGYCTDTLIKSFCRQVRLHLLLMIKTICTYNLWCIVATESYIHHDMVYISCPNKQHNLTLTLDKDLTVTCQSDDATIKWSNLPGKSILHKLALLLNVFCEPPYLTHV